MKRAEITKNKILETAEQVKLMEDIDTFGMSIQKLTAGQVDQNRTWDMEHTMPNAVTDIENFAKRTDALYAKLQKISGADPAYADRNETLVLLRQGNRAPLRCVRRQRGQGHFGGRIVLFQGFL